MYKYIYIYYFLLSIWTFTRTTWSMWVNVVKCFAIYKPSSKVGGGEWVGEWEKETAF